MNGAQIRREEVCLQAASEDGAIVFMDFCGKNKEAEKWVHNRNGQTIHTNSSLCLDMKDFHKQEPNYARLRPCDVNKIEQVWQFRNYNQ